MNAIKPRERHQTNRRAIDSAAGGMETATVHRLRADGAVHAAPSAETTELRRALVATELKCAAALRLIQRMRRRDSQRKREAVSLKEAVSRAQRFAYHDELTGLPNRHSLLDHFNMAAALAARHDEHVGLLFLDFDGFKQVNDTLGHSV